MVFKTSYRKLLFTILSGRTLQSVWSRVHEHVCLTGHQTLNSFHFISYTTIADILLDLRILTAYFILLLLGDVLFLTLHLCVMRGMIIKALLQVTLVAYV